MEKAEKLRPVQSFPSLCHSPRSNPELRAVLLRKAVSVSELVARWVFSLWLQFTSDPRGSRENSPSPTSVTNRSHSDKIFPKHRSQIAGSQVRGGCFLPPVLLSVIDFQCMIMSWKTSPDLKSRHTRRSSLNKMTQRNLPLTPRTGAFPGGQLKLLILVVCKVPQGKRANAGEMS